MSRHRAEPARRHAARPRYGRLAVLGTSVSVTAIAMLGGLGVLPSVAEGDGRAGAHLGQVAADAAAPSTQLAPTTQPTPTAASAARAEPTQTVQSAASKQQPKDPPVPAHSGEGKRIVFDQSDQRVWLVDEDGTVERTYPVSGSLYDNLFPGTYSVYSRSEQAWGVDDSGTMKYFVRFTQGTNGAAIGFHDIPIDHGHLVQTAAQLGTPQSHGCIRQLRPDAIALWNFAPVGTEVDVTA
jgi:lipoprotein-anchoring transpeptidase ErfK/SrfK